MYKTFTIINESEHYVTFCYLYSECETVYSYVQFLCHVRYNDNDFICKWDSHSRIQNFSSSFMLLLFENWCGA